MCGIAGWFGGTLSQGNARRRLDAMCDEIVHRGPDDRGQFFAPGIALGMQRLSIVDLDHGQQPMASNDGAVQVIFNGEIYNHAALRAQEEARGVSFQTSSDTEVILRLYERMGLECLSLFNGMFAIAIWDARTQQLHLVRDRLGVKPLYWRFDGTQLVFASEIKAILAADPLSRPAVNQSAIWDYLTFRYVPGPQTVWEGISKLQPGHRLTLEKGGEPTIIRYWDIPRPSQQFGRSPHELQQTFDELLIDATALRMRADVPVGVMLSGGLDSSCVAAAAREAGFDLRTYSVAFRNAPEIDERPYAREVAEHLGCEHSEVEIGPEEFSNFLPEFVRLTDEPLADLASIPLYYVSKLAQQDVKVVVSGEGSDEVLGGYTFDTWAKRWHDESKQSGGLGGAIGRLLGVPSRQPDLRQMPEPFTMTNYMTSEQKRQLLAGAADYRDSLDTVRDRLAAFGAASPLAQALYTYCGDWLVEDLLMKADRMSMGVSLELRTPFLDYRLVEFAAALPDHLRVGKDTDGEWKTKLVLRRFAEKRLPTNIIDRPKQGFPVPVYGWLSDRLRDWAHEMIDGPNTRLRTWCKRDALAAQLQAGTHIDAEMLDRHRLWNLIILELWARKWA